VSEYLGYCYNQQSGDIKILSAIEEKLGKKKRKLDVTSS
jgi:hypothetical protein